MDVQSLWREAVIFAGESWETGRLIAMPDSRWDPALQKRVSVESRHSSIGTKFPRSRTSAPWVPVPSGSEKVGAVPQKVPSLFIQPASIY